MKVFIVGGTGFVGVNLANRLCARGDEVTVMGHAAARPRDQIVSAVLDRSDPKPLINDGRDDHNRNWRRELLRERGGSRAHGERPGRIVCRQ